MADIRQILIIGCMAASLSVTAPLCLYAQDTSDKAPDAADKANAIELKTIEKQLDLTRDRQKKLEGEVSELEDEAEKLSGRLVELASEIQSRESMITAAEKRIGDLNFEEKVLAARLVRRRNAMSELLVGLQRLERNPPPPLAAHPEDAVAALRSAALFDSVLAELKTRANALRLDLAKLENLRASLKTEREDLQNHVTKLQQSHVEIGDLRKRKLSLLQLTDKQLKEEERRAEDLAKKSRSLKQLLSALAEERKRREAEDKKRALAEKRKAEIEKRKAEERARRPRIAFTQTKGRLGFPVQGQQLRKFGDPDGFNGRTKGLYIASRKKAQVTAPADARVEFAGTFRSYGKLLILDVGEGYHVLLAGLGEISVKTGQFLRSGEPVGLMGSSPARGTLIGDQLEDPRPILYVEFRRNSSAVDPEPWWIGNRKEARK